MSKLRGTAALLVAPALLWGCHSNPVLVDDGNLTAELVLSSGHVHTLSEVAFDVVIRNGDGYAVDDFEAVSVERRSAGGAWRSIDLEASGIGYAGTYTFTSSGDYDLRVMVTRHGTGEPVEVPLADGPMMHLEVARAHVEVAGHRVEFETFPGHIHEGDEVEVKFWILEPERNAEGVRPPVTGLDTRVLCFELGELVEEHQALDEADGVYQVRHLFSSAGDAAATLRFPDDDGDEVAASFEFHVVHGH